MARRVTAPRILTKQSLSYGGWVILKTAEHPGSGLEKSIRDD